MLSNTRTSLSFFIHIFFFFCKTNVNVSASEIGQRHSMYLTKSFMKSLNGKTWLFNIHEEGKKIQKDMKVLWVCCGGGGIFFDIRKSNRDQLYSVRFFSLKANLFIFKNPKNDSFLSKKIIFWFGFDS